MDKRVLLSLLLVLPALSACGGDQPEADDRLIEQGRGTYEQVCATCHGIDLQGSEQGPPFLSPIYAPNHHPDEAFYAAVQNGVEPHHWDFGAMPPQPRVSEEDVAAIVAYIRAEQLDAGITHDPSHP